MNNAIILDKSEFINLLNISLGYYKPITQFCTDLEYKLILKNGKINNFSWNIPILLSIKKKISEIKKKKIFLIYENKKVGHIIAESFFKINKKKFCKTVFKTNSMSHPTVKKIYNTKNFFVGGKTTLYNKRIPKDKYFIFNKKEKFNNDVVFSTRNLCHLGHQHIHEQILRKNKKLTICIIDSEKNKFDSTLLVKSYLCLKKNVKLYKNIKIVKIFLPLLYAGPNEAMLQAILFSNIKFKGFIVGRDHAGFKNFYSKYSSQNAFEKKKINKIKIIKNKEPLMCGKCSIVSFENKITCRCYRHKKMYLGINGKDIKYNLVRNNFKLIKKYLNPVIYNFCAKNLIKIRNFNT
jgi:sulfate adenylyltransferase